MRLLSSLSRGVAGALVSLLLVASPALADEPGDQPAALEGAQAEETAAVEPEREAPVGLEEIVITATKREMNLQDTPVAITAFDTKNYEDLNISHGTDFTVLVPSVSYRVSPNRLTIRGVGRTDNSLGLDPGVAMYTDGMYTSETAGLFRSSFGTERIEIMRGPQGTLYGRNATGGAVNIITQHPSDEFHVQGRARIGNFDEREYAMIVTGPITERLRYHLLASHASREGWEENIAGRDGRTNDGTFYEGQLEFDITDNLNLWVKVNKALWDYDAGTAGSEAPYNTCCQTDTLTFSSSRNYDVLRPGVRDALKTNVNPEDLPSIRLQDTWHINVQLNWDLGDMNLKYMWGQQTYDWNYRHGDLDNTSRTDGDVINFAGDSPGFFGFDLGLIGRQTTRPGANQYQLYIREDKQYYQHELQLTSDTDSDLQWIVGLYTYDEEIEQPFTTYKALQDDIQNVCLSCNGGDTWWDLSVIVPNVSTAGGNPAANGVLYHQLGKLKSNAWAVYGEVYYQLTERIKLTAGLRHSRDRRHAEEYQVVNLDPFLYSVDYPTFAFVDSLAPGPPFFIGGFGFLPGGKFLMGPPENIQLAAEGKCCAWEFGNRKRRLTDSWDALTGRFVLEYTPNDDALFYASIAQGYKSGGFRLGSFDQSDPIFDQEDIISYEMGYKTTLFDNRLLINAAAFYYDYEDKDELVSFVDDATSITHASVLNAEEVEIYGFELETRWLVTDNLSLQAVYSYNKGEFEDFCCLFDTANRDANGNGIPGEPADNQDLKGNDVPQTPENKISIGVSYSIDTDWGTFAVHPRWSWVDKQTYDVFNNLYAPSYTRTDVTLTWTHVENRWKVIFYGKNLSDEINFSSYGLGDQPSTCTGTCSDFRQTFGGTPNPPRTFGVEVLFRY